MPGDKEVGGILEAKGLWTAELQTAVELGSNSAMTS